MPCRAQWERKSRLRIAFWRFGIQLRADIPASKLSLTEDIDECEISLEECVWEWGPGTGFKCNPMNLFFYFHYFPSSRYVRDPRTRNCVKADWRNFPFFAEKNRHHLVMCSRWLWLQSRVHLGWLFARANTRNGFWCCKELATAKYVLWSF